MQVVRSILMAPLALLPMLMSVLGAVAGIYWIYICVHLSKWFWLFAGVVFPPLGLVGGLLALFGVIFQPDPSVAVSEQKRNLAYSRGVLVGVVATAERCRWQDTSVAEIDQLSKARNMLGDMLRKDHQVTDGELAMIDGASKGAADTVACSDDKIHRGVRDMLDQMAKR